MKWLSHGLLVVISVILMLSLSGCGCGRKKKDDSANTPKLPDIVNRMQDKVYVEALEKHRDDQKLVARGRNELAERMRVFVERIKAGLPADISQEDLKAALEKEEEWQGLVKEQSVLDQGVLDALHEARETVRERIMKDASEAKAATGG